MNHNWISQFHADYHLDNFRSSHSIFFCSWVQVKSYFCFRYWALSLWEVLHFHWLLGFSFPLLISNFLQGVYYNRLSFFIWWFCSSFARDQTVFTHFYSNLNLLAPIYLSFSLIISILDFQFFLKNSIHFVRFFFYFYYTYISF